jgi:hypothetical protein
MKGWHAFVLLLLLSLCAVAPMAAQDSPTLFVDAGEGIGEVSPYLYGVNYGPLQFISHELMPLAEASGIRFMRFPGGRWGDLNDLQPYQLNAFMALAQQIDAEVNIHVRLENGTPEAAANLVRYMNIESGYNVRYWSVGNEPDLFDDYTTEDLNREWRLIAEAMLEVDPDIILIGPDVSQWNGTPEVNPVDPEGRDWLREFLLANGDLVDIVSIHRYPFPRSQGNPVTKIDELRQNTEEWDTIIPALREVIAETTGRDLPVSIGEASSHWSRNMFGEATPDSHYSAIWWADVLGRLSQHEPLMVNYYNMQSSDSLGGWGLFATYDVRPVYYVYQIYQRFGTELLATDSIDENINVYAARRDDGALTLVLVNLASEAASANLEISNFTAADPAEVWLFDAEHRAELIGELSVGTEIALDLPAESVTLYVIPSE